jgi:uncharacterized protein YjbJ (UPF0337 family)
VSKKDKAKNHTQIATGKVEEVVGGAIGDDDLKTDGQIEQSKGHLKQAGEHIKDALQ